MLGVIIIHIRNMNKHGCRINVLTFLSRNNVQKCYGLFLMKLCLFFIIIMIKCACSFIAYIQKVNLRETDESLRDKPRSIILKGLSHFYRNMLRGIKPRRD